MLPAGAPSVPFSMERDSRTIPRDVFETRDKAKPRWWHQNPADQPTNEIFSAKTWNWRLCQFGWSRALFKVKNT